MKWFLLWWLVAGASYGPLAAASTGPFDSRAACEAALRRLVLAKSDVVRDVDGVCVPSEVPPMAPQPPTISR